jgi:hypothetical protein
MVDVQIHGDSVVFEVEGMHKLWALRSRLEIPLAHVRGVRADPAAARGLWRGLRLAGADIPGLFAAGTFFRHGELVFYDVRDPSHAIVVDLDDETYERLVVEVRDPAAAVARITDALRARDADRGVRATVDETDDPS